VLEVQVNELMAISLHQPWASGVAVGSKKIETRHWATDYRGPLAIHAALEWNREYADKAVELIRLGAKLPNPETWGGTRYMRRLERWLPLGAVVALVELVDCVQMTDEWIEQQAPLERALGGYEPGRFGWALENVRAMRVPVKVKGRQSFWRLSEEESLAVLAQAERAA